ncbi:MAG: hypothetical protein LAO76_22515 [Acidobacteriia bacterium]|nr:hypothetical protein [Terriglobia bacterium]
MSNPIFTPHVRGGLAVVLLTITGLLGYTVHQHYQVKQISAQNDQVIASLNDTRAQMAALAAKIDSLNTPPAAQPAPVKAPSTTRPHTRPAARYNANDVRIRHLQTQVDAQGRAIDSTRQELVSTRTDLEGGIARTHEELVTLQKKGERNYFEFDLDKTKQFQRTGPIALSLRKANTKHMYADLEIRVEDAEVSQKHVNLFQPVLFYTEQGRPVELVINSIRHDHIHGYISAPKYSAAELAVSSPDGAKRQKLELPR